VLSQATSTLSQRISNELVPFVT